MDAQANGGANQAPVDAGKAAVTVVMEDGQPMSDLYEFGVVFANAIYWEDSCWDDDPAGVTSLYMGNVATHESMHMLGFNHRFHPCFAGESMMYFQCDTQPGGCFSSAWDDERRRDIQYPNNSWGPYPMSYWVQ